MPKIKYQELRLGQKKLDMINKVNDIIEDFAAQGFTMSLRQVYYQLVSKALIDNNEKEYKNLGTVVSDGRMTGLIDWEAIVDRGRFIRKLSHWASPEEIIRDAQASFRLSRWVDQPYYCEVFIEKDALVGVIEGVCERLDVPYLACRGYASASELWRAGQRLKHQAKKYGKKLKVFYLGDHDPSGIDMTRDVQERLSIFSGYKVDVVRLALNKDQIQQYNPPPNPTKLTDSRASYYIAQHGYTCWELDALEPRVISDLITDAVLAIHDKRKWQATERKESTHKQDLETVASSWDDAVMYCRNL